MLSLIKNGKNRNYVRDRDLYICSHGILKARLSDCRGILPVFFNFIKRAALKNSRFFTVACLFLITGNMIRNVRFVSIAKTKITGFFLHDFPRANLKMYLPAIASNAHFENSKQTQHILN